MDTSACVFYYAVGTNESGITNEEVGIYPNPTTGLFTLEINGNKGQDSKIKIYDVLGHVILQSTIATANTKKSTIDMSRVSKGIYFVEVATDSQIIRKRIVKE